MSKCQCLGCPNCKIDKINPTYFNINCVCCGWERTVATYTTEKECEENKIIIPIWCSYNKPMQTAFIKWSEIEPQVKWSDIKIGDEFHIPPFNHNKRQNIKVLNITPSFFSYTSDSSRNIEFMYPTYASYKMMVRHKRHIEKSL